MSDIIGFLFGGLCGFSLAIVLFADYVKIHSSKLNNSNPYVMNPSKNMIFLGYQPRGTLNTDNPPRGGTGVPSKYTKMQEADTLECGEIGIL